MIKTPLVATAIASAFFLGLVGGMFIPVVISNTSSDYVPFTTSIDSRMICVGDNGGTEGHRILITNKIPESFIITSIILAPQGIDEDDGISLDSIWLDKDLFFFRISDITEQDNSQLMGPFELMGMERFPYPDLPRQIVSSGKYYPPIVISISCTDITEIEEETNAIIFPPDGIVVSGWKLVEDEITVEFLPALR